MQTRLCVSQKKSGRFAGQAPAAFLTPNLMIHGLYIAMHICSARAFGTQELFEAILKSRAEALGPRLAKYDVHSMLGVQLIKEVCSAACITMMGRLLSLAACP